jgi:uncharacterized protein YyaL (SSP411 family)
MHSWSGNRAEIAGIAADQVYLLEALVDAYQYSGQRKYLDRARDLAAIVTKSFRAPSSGLIMNRTGKKQENVVADAVAGPQVFYDAPMPSIEATAAIAMAKLAAITNDPSYSKAADELMAHAPAMASSTMGSSLGTVGLALEYHVHPQAVVAVVVKSQDNSASDLWNAALATYRPGKVVTRVQSESIGALPTAARAMAVGSADKKTSLAFVCAGTACATPTHDSAKLTELVRTFLVRAPTETRVASDAGPVSGPAKPHGQGRAQHDQIN